MLTTLALAAIVGIVFVGTLFVASLALPGRTKAARAPMVSCGATG